MANILYGNSILGALEELAYKYATQEEIDSGNPIHINELFKRRAKMTEENKTPETEVPEVPVQNAPYRGRQRFAELNAEIERAKLEREQNPQ